MIAKPLDQIVEADILELVSNGVSESRTIDYKQQLQDLSDAGRRNCWPLSHLLQIQSEEI